MALSKRVVGLGATILVLAALATGVYLRISQEASAEESGPGAAEGDQYEDRATATS